MWFCEKCVDKAAVTMKPDQVSIGNCKDLMDKMDLLSSKIDSLASLNTRVKTLEQQMRSSKASIDKIIDIRLLFTHHATILPKFLSPLWPNIATQFKPKYSLVNHCSL